MGDYACIPGVNGQIRVATYEQENPRTPPHIRRGPRRMNVPFSQ
jgi:hypothetical protein